MLTRSRNSSDKIGYNRCEVWAYSFILRLTSYVGGTDYCVRGRFFMSEAYCASLSKSENLFGDLIVTNKKTAFWRLINRRMCRRERNEERQLFAAGSPPTWLVEKRDRTHATTNQLFCAASGANLTVQNESFPFCTLPTNTSVHRMPYLCS